MHTGKTRRASEIHAKISLKYVRWLVVDEADKLLDQSFQQWLDIVMGEIHSSKRNIRDRVRKVILSATMTTDIGQLTSLKLYRPNLVVLEGSSSDCTESAHQLAIPALLKESGVKIEDDTIKPLYLIELLKRTKLIPEIQTDESATSSDSDSSDSDSDSDSDSEASSDSDSSDSESDLASSVNSENSQQIPSNPISTESSALIFTKSNETAVRLGRLIALLCPQVSSKLGTLTSTTPRQSRQRTIASFSAGKTPHHSRCIRPRISRTRSPKPCSCHQLRCPDQFDELYTSNWTNGESREARACLDFVYCY